MLIIILKPELLAEIGHLIVHK